jgi:hypothetical protein
MDSSKPSAKPVPTDDDSAKPSAKPVTFLEDPTRDNSKTMFVDTDQIDPLHGNHWLSTTLTDYLLQRTLGTGLGTAVPDNVLIPTADMISSIHNFLKRNKSSTSSDIRSCDRARKNYQFYSFRPYVIVASACIVGHFFVAVVSFDANDKQVFTNVQLYDSLRRAPRHKQKDKIASNTMGARFLVQLQEFLLAFVFFESPEKNMKQLKDDKDYILRKVEYKPCPQQRNGVDCSLFGLVSLLHIIADVPLNEQTFTQENITEFRKYLYQILSVGFEESVEPNTRTHLSADFVPSFFHSLASLRTQDWEFDPHVLFVREVRTPAAASMGPAFEALLPGAPGASAAASTTALAVSIATMPATAASVSPTVQSECIIPFQDTVFKATFVDADVSFKNTGELMVALLQYETTSEIKLKVVRSVQNARTFQCALHDGCSFQARFGSRRADSEIVLKDCKLQHTGVPRGPLDAGGRRWKQRRKGRLANSVDNVCLVKASEPKPMDVKKTAANIGYIDASYHESWRAIQSHEGGCRERNFLSFEYLEPYLDAFEALNEGSTTHIARNDDNEVLAVFICPGFMNLALKNVRPVLSLDAAHLKSEWKGTLYTASVKTGLDELYPVAIAIICDNEDYDHWLYFLRLLKRSCSMLEMAHTLSRVTFQYYQFISDRDKGLKEALAAVFPGNHATSCAIHIKRNVQTKFGQKAAEKVSDIAKCFSARQEDFLLNQVQKASAQAREYLVKIPAMEWRGTEWMANTSLPPRYGITSSNMSEATNSMFDDFRGLCWLDCMEGIINKMSTRIATLRMESKGKEADSVVPRIQALLRDRWNNCAGCQVIQVEDDCSSYTVTRPATITAEPQRVHIIEVEQKWCTCGQWQEHGVPCIDACAYFRLFLNQTEDLVLTNHVSEHYKYSQHQELMKPGICPVVIDTLRRDEITRPPPKTGKRTSGRPKKKRIRRRSKFRTTEESTISCTNCGARGHNIRSCAARQEQARQEQEALHDIS